MRGFRFPAVVVLWLMFPVLCHAQAATGGLSGSELRVGIVAIDDAEAEFAAWSRLFQDFMEEHPGLQVRVALGTYGDLIHWMRQELIDVAIVTPGVFAESLKAPDAATTFEYVATSGLPPATSLWASDERRDDHIHYTYRSVCIVGEHSSLRSAADIRQAAAAGRLQFIFVHPLSVSGRIAPEIALRELHIKPVRNQIVYSSSHANSLRLVGETSGIREPQLAAPVERVAFVWDDAALPEGTAAAGVRQIAIEPLNGLVIPHDVVCMRAASPLRSELQEWLLARDSGEIPGFSRLADWREQYDRVSGWSRQLGISATADAAQSVSLNELSQALLHSASFQPQPIRLAVVLSGGGAKCSYQVGAVAAVEEQLEKLRRIHEDPELDIGLVVGTSGGAINALPVSMAITASAEGREDFRSIWQQLDQRQIVRPSRIVRWNQGVWCALIAVSLVVFLVRCCIREPARHARTTGVLLVALGAVEMLASYAKWSPWTLLGMNHVWHHLWLWFTFGLRTSAWCLLILGFATLGAQWHLKRRGAYFHFPTRPLAWVLAVLLTGLPLLQIVTVLAFQTTLSSGEGIEASLSEHFPALINADLRRRGTSPLELDSEMDDAQTLRTISREVMQRNLLQRDLVITGNAIESSVSGLPSDLYFYAGADSQTQAAFGPRAVALEEHPNLLLDVVLGSGSIFPVFPARRLNDFPESGEYVELIDGGFAHNTPIEAAVLWGATHVLLIEATPQHRRPRRNFAENAAAAFMHLHKQTQLVDVRSKRQVVVFTLAPEPPHLCVLDFADNLIAASIQRGYEDAGGAAEKAGLASHFTHFRKELGEPVFTDVEQRGAPRGDL